MSTPGENSTTTSDVPNQARLIGETRQNGVVRQDIRLSMTDGIELAMLVFRPDDDDAYPALLTRTPYGIEGATMQWEAIGQSNAAAGYVAVFQDVRGTHASGGSYALAGHDREDSKDTIDWIIAQPWSDQTVGLTGGSAMGMTTWLAAAVQHPAVKVIFAGSTGRAFDGFGYYAPGVIQPDTMFGWAANQLLPDQLSRNGGSATDPAVQELTNTDSTDLFLEVMTLGEGQDERRGELLTAMGKAIAAKQAAVADLGSRPTEAAKALGEHMPWVAEWTAHPDPADPFWATIDYADVLDSLAVPGLHTVGWHDLFIRGEIRSYTQAAVASSALQKLVINPYTHLGAAAPVGEWTPPFVGTPDTIAPGGMSFAPTPELMTRWFNHYLKDERN